MAMLTPGASGGAVAQALILRSYHVPIGKAAPIVLSAKLYFLFLFLIIMLPFILVTEPIDVPYITNSQLIGISIFVVISTFMGMIYYKHDL